MKYEFIGHGIKGNIGTVGDYICSSLKDKEFNSFIAFSAFTKMSGINIFKDELIVAANNNFNIKFYLGIVEKGTSKEVLEFMLENSIETWTFCTSSALMFHPKIYIFKGNNITRFILGSSNLTKQGLFDNIEASILLEFKNSDSQGQKFMNQFLGYFETILDGTDKNIERLNDEVLEDLVNSGFVHDEHKTYDDLTFTKKNSNLFKKRTKKLLRKEELGNIKYKPVYRSNSIYDEEITEYYRQTWDELFNEFIEYSKKENRLTVARDCENRRLYKWYRRQKIFYATDKMPEEHFNKLLELGFDFRDAMKLRFQNIEEEWLDILEDAIKDNEDVRANHRYIYKDRRLGTWLSGVFQDNKKGKKLELKEKINELGFYFKSYSRVNEHVVERYITELLSDKKPNKHKYRNKFNGQILPKKDEISKEWIQKVDEAWELQFGEKPKWKIISKSRDYTEEWKAFRYNKEINPEGKWYASKKYIGDIYEWVWAKRKSKKRMSLVLDKFNRTELEELKKEGFPI